MRSSLTLVSSRHLPSVGGSISKGHIDKVALIELTLDEAQRRQAKVEETRLAVDPLADGQTEVFHSETRLTVKAEVYPGFVDQRGWCTETLLQRTIVQREHYQIQLSILTRNGHEDLLRGYPTHREAGALPSRIQGSIEVDREGGNCPGRTGNSGMGFERKECSHPSFGCEPRTLLSLRATG